MYKEIIFALLLGVGLSASCGFRVFLPLLVSSLAAYFQWLPEGVTNQVAWMATLPAIITFATASLVEIGGYYIPVVDHFLDLIATPLAIAAGTFLTASFLHIDNEMIRWGLGLIVGGGAAGIVQTGTVFTRLLSSKTTLTTGNGLLATGENTMAFTGAIFAFIVPVIAGFLGITIVLIMLYFIKRSRARLAKMKQKLAL
ncbi:MAG: hypothetical protein BGO31_14565 [Bacteroidetes bacterium 43-16]|nr:MAG: hypothetical protein BGO31_14565 [Bacteroidetes bacterium 43-16]